MIRLLFQTLKKQEYFKFIFRELFTLMRIHMSRNALIMLKKYLDFALPNAYLEKYFTELKS